MYPILLRVCLLLLLAVDWATDPWHGTSPSSQPLASTEVVWRSAESEGGGGAAWSPTLAYSPIEYVVAVLGSVYEHPLRPMPVFILSGADRACLFMSLQC